MNASLRLRDLGHGGFREEATTHELPFLLLLQHLAGHQAGHSDVVGEEAYYVAATLDLLVHSLKRVVFQILRHCSCGKFRNASKLSRAATMIGTAEWNCLRSISVTLFQWART
jgi:hypothetical protein